MPRQGEKSQMKFIRVCVCAAVLAAAGNASAGTSFNLADYVADPTKVIVSGNLLFDQFTYATVGGPTVENTQLITGLYSYGEYSLSLFNANQSVNESALDMLLTFRVRSVGQPIAGGKLFAPSPIFGTGTVQVTSVSLDNNMVLSCFNIKPPGDTKLADEVVFDTPVSSLNIVLDAYAMAGPASIARPGVVGNVFPLVSPGAQTIVSQQSDFTPLTSASNALLTTGTVQGPGGNKTLNSLHIGTGTKEDPAVMLVENGTLATPNGILIGENGVLKGSAQITGTLVNSGKVSPGNSPGTLTVVGDYAQSGLLDIEIAGLNSINFDHLDVSGNAYITGDIQISLLSGFTPTNGQTYRFLTAGNIEGTPTLLTAGWELHEVTISGGEALEAVATGFAAVPEPASIAVLGAGVAMLLGRKRRR